MTTNLQHRFDLGNGYWVEVTIFSNRTGEAYFTGDFSADIDTLGCFTHPWTGAQFRVILPNSFNSEGWALEQSLYQKVA